MQGGQEIDNLPRYPKMPVKKSQMNMLLNYSTASVAATEVVVRWWLAGWLEVDCLALTLL